MAITKIESLAAMSAYKAANPSAWAMSWLSYWRCTPIEQNRQDPGTRTQMYCVPDGSPENLDELIAVLIERGQTRNGVKRYGLSIVHPAVVAALARAGYCVTSNRDTVRVETPEPTMPPPLTVQPPPGTMHTVPLQSKPYYEWPLTDIRKARPGGFKGKPRYEWPKTEEEWGRLFALTFIYGVIAAIVISIPTCGQILKGLGL